jgi:Uma2 family endonuclease
MEQSSPDKHEYLDGTVYLMAGGTARHTLIAMNVAAAIRPHLRGGPCRLYSGDLRIRPDDQAYFYPDLVVVCGAAPSDTALETENPTLVVEILSPLTRGIDRIVKFRRYRNAVSLREYVLIDSQEPVVDVYRLEADGHWGVESYQPPEGIHLDSIDMNLDFSTIYEDVDWAARLGSG